MKKIIALIMICLLAFSQSVMAADFADMPNDWSTDALNAAVRNGLLSGDGGYIKPSDSLTRAEMATIMVRACGAINEADLSNYTDVSPDAWYYSSMAKAVAMGAFTGSDGKLNPESYITRQEAFVVLARVFSLDIDKNINVNILEKFKDKDAVASWAKTAVASIIANGYVAGSNGYLNPESNISRAEFAVVMDRLVSYYIDDASISTIPSDGNVMIRVGDFSLDGVQSDKMIILGDALGTSTAKITNAKLSERLVVRGGKKVIVEGEFGEVRLIRPGIRLECEKATAKRLYSCNGSIIDVGVIWSTLN